jgi:hypothetical protein
MCQSPLMNMSLIVNPGVAEIMELSCNALKVGIKDFLGHYSTIPTQLQDDVDRPSLGIFS